jgi:hypothetical protein
MVEAVATLPVFIILFVGIFYVRETLVVTQELDTKARSCAWRYSRNACQNIPKDCEGFLEIGSSSPGNEDSVARVNESLEGVKRAAGSSDGDGEKFVEKMAGKLIGPAIEDLFSKMAVASPVRKVERPMLFGGQAVTIKGHYQLACDLEEAKPLDIAKSAWNLARGK